MSTGVWNVMQEKMCCPMGGLMNAITTHTTRSKWWWGWCDDDPVSLISKSTSPTTRVDGMESLSWVEWRKKRISIGLNYSILMFEKLPRFSHSKVHKSAAKEFLILILPNWIINPLLYTFSSSSSSIFQIIPLDMFQLHFYVQSSQWDRILLEFSC